MARALGATLAILALWGVASWFTRSRAAAVAAGTAVAFGLFALAHAASPPDLRAGAAVHLAVAAGLLGLAWTRERRRRSGTPSPSAPEPVAFVRHWRGEGALRAALLRVLVLLAALCCLALALDAAPLHLVPRLVAGATVAAWALAIPLLGWALVGLWRCAGARVDRGGSRLVAWPAKAGVVLGGLLLVPVVAFEAAPDVEEYGPVALGPPERERYALRVLRDGTELELAGELAWGAGEDFEAALAAHPGVRVVHLDSPGGRIFEARRLAKSILDRRLTTYVANRCESACVRAFAAGEERWLSTRAAVGLHRASGYDVTRAQLRRTGDELVAFLEARGVDREFARRGLETPAEDIWRPAHEELFRARLATGYAGTDDVALSGYSARDRERLDLKLRESDLFQALYEFERPLFERAVVAMRAGIDAGRSEDEAVGFLGDEVERILYRDLPRTSDAAARGFYEAFLSAGRAAERRGPEDCAAFLEAETGNWRPPAPGVARALDRAVGRVIAGAALEPRRPPRHGEVSPVLGRVLAGAAARAVDLDAMDEPGAATRRPAEYCDAMLAFLEEIAALPPHEAGPLVRYLAAGGRQVRGPPAD